MRPGDIYLYEDFYLSRQTGELKPKYLVILSFTPARDVVARLLTSRAHGRPESPPCYHGHPYPAFYLGVIGGRLMAKSWVDLRALDDLDEACFARQRSLGRVRQVGELPVSVLTELLECVAGADDTTRLQERCIRNLIAGLR